MDLLRIVLLTLVVFVGIFRILKNHLLSYERVIYILGTLSVLWFDIVYAINLFFRDRFYPHEVFRDWINLGWIPLSATLLLFMLYYRRAPKKE